MPKFIVHVTHTMSGTVEVVAKDKEEVEQMWGDGELFSGVELDEELYGGIPWEMERIEKTEQERS